MFYIYTFAVNIIMPNDCTINDGKIIKNNIINYNPS